MRGDDAECVEVADRIFGRLLEAVGDAAATPRIGAFVAQCEAELARAKRVPGASRWRALFERWTLIDERYPAAYAAFRAAEAHLLGDHRRARLPAAELLRTAAEAAAAMGAAPLLADVEALARRARLPLGPEPERQPIPAVANEVAVTPREREVLRLLADGFSNGEIGRALFISTKTASTHVSNILRKLDASNRVEAAGLAIRLGLVDA